MPCATHAELARAMDEKIALFEGSAMGALARTVLFAVGMASSLFSESKREPAGDEPIRPIDEVEKLLRLAEQLCTRLSIPFEGEQELGVRLRLARAQALSVVDLLKDIASARTHGG